MVQVLTVVLAHLQCVPQCGGPAIHRNNHINSVCWDAKRRVAFLYRQFHLAGTPCLYQLYKSFVLPTLDYCSSVYSPIRYTWPPRFFTPHLCLHLRYNHHLLLYYPSFRTSAHKFSFSVSVVPLWNSLRRDLVSSPSCDSFKSCLSLMLL